MEYIRTNIRDWCARSDLNADILFRVVSALPDLDGVWLAGGAVRRTISGASLDSDYDFFFRDADTLEKWSSLLPSNFAPVRETEHHKQWRGTIDGVDGPIDVQAIRFKYYASVEEVIDSFDYTICMVAVSGDDLVTTPEALWDLGRKRLAIHRVTYPVSTMRRMLKYTGQGYTACQGCMATLLRETARNPTALENLDIAYVD